MIKITVNLLRMLKSPTYICKDPFMCKPEEFSTAITWPLQIMLLLTGTVCLIRAITMNKERVFLTKKIVLK